jgi:hypothetical protein
MLGRLVLQLCRQGIQQLVFSNAQRLSVVAQRVFGDDLVFALAQQYRPMVGAVLGVLDLGIDGSKVKAQLAEMFRFELAALEFDHHVTAQLEMVKQQVNEEFVARHIEQNLPPDEGKARAEFKQEFGDVFE